MIFLFIVVSIFLKLFIFL